MTMMSIFQISGSALAAESERLNVTASNLSNVNTTSGPDGQPYRAKQVLFATDPLGSQSATSSPIGGVKVTGVIEDPTPLKTVYDPNNPGANADGYVSLPNVDPVQEMVNMISASRAYQADVETLNTAKTLMLKTLTLGQ
jgi:flagellar basal-body rod protein FlgC